MNKDQVKKLYDATSQEYGLPEFNLFFNSLQDEKKRKEFFDLANVKYDIGNSVEEFENNLGLKKKIQSEELVQIEPEEPKKSGGASLPMQSNNASNSSQSELPSQSPSVSKPVYDFGATDVDIKSNAKKLFDQFYSTSKKKVDDAMAEYNSQVDWLNNEIKNGGITRMEVDSLAKGFKAQADRKVRKAKEEYDVQVADVTEQANSLLSKFKTGEKPVTVGEPLKNLRGADQTKIAARAKELGVDALALSSAINDFEADDDFILSKVNELVTNKPQYDKSKAAYTWRSILKQTMKKNGLPYDEINKKFDFATQLQKLDVDPKSGEKVTATYASSLQRVSKIRDIINENISKEGDRREAMRALNIDAYAAIYQGMKEQEVVNGWAKTGNVFIGAGLDMLKLTDPQRAKTLEERINNQYASNEDKALYLRELENIGLNAITFEVDRGFNRATRSDNVPSENFLNALTNWKSLAEQTKRSQINRYSDITNADVDRMLLDVTEGLETSTGTKAVYNIAAGASEWLERGLSGIWDYATKNEEERIAADMKRDHSKYITEEVLNYGDVGSSLREAEYIPKLVDPEIKKQVDGIMANTSMSRNEKYEAVYPLIKNAYASGGIEFFSNPNKGNINLTSKNVLHLLSTSGARSVGNMIPAVITGGGGSTALIAGLDAAAMKYDEQFREGENNPLARSLRSGLTVGALAGIMDEAAAFSKALKGGSASLVAKPTAIGSAKTFGSSVGKEILEEELTLALDGDLVRDWKETMLSTAIIAPLFAGPTAIIDNRRSSEMYRQLWYEAGATPELTKNGLKKMRTEGSITESQYNDGMKRVDRMSQIVANMPKTDLKGNPLSDSQKAKYADNLMKKYDAQAIPETLPTKVAENITNEAQKADEENAAILEGTMPEPPAPAAGKRLFNEPNPEAAVIENEFKASKGINTPEPEKITKLDEEKSKTIADAYEQLVDSPDDPEVQKAYQAMADETMDQFSAIEKAGVKVEIWTGEGEPYKNSEEMIKDVRDNKHMYIFSTEEGFGDSPITDQQRQQNALLRDSGVKDVNGKPLLINDIFRFVHDYFGHTRLGNSFGAIGEENAWNVHARMYSPLARRAMTTETRGQNSWVNFNKAYRNPDGTMKKKGDEGFVPPAQRPFAEQKMALLPEEFSNIEDNYSVKPAVSPLRQQLRDRVGKGMQDRVSKASAALASTGVVINMVEDPAEFDNKVAQLGGQKGLEGVFISDTGEIFINKSKLDQGIADGRVIWHEASHPVVNIVRNTNPKLFNQVMSGLKQAAANNKGVADALTWAETNYAEDGQGTIDDEAVVETIAGIADGQIDINSLSTGLKQSIIEFINSIAKALGLGQILNDTDVAAFKKLAGQVADALTTGKDISEIVGQENVKNYISNLESPELAAGGTMNAPQARVTTAPAVNVYASKDVVQLEQRSLNDVYEKFGGKAVVINSDPTRVGTLTLPSGKTIFMYGGPAYLSVKDNVDGNVGFATTQLSKVNTWSNYVNELFGDQPGVTLVGTQAPTSMLSNSYALRYVMDAISMLPKSVLRSSDFKNEFFGKDLVALKDAFGEQGYKQFVDKYKKADLSNPEVIDGMIAEMAYTVGDNNSPASFKARGAFVSNLLGGIAPKASLKGVEGDQGYVSKKPNKYIAKQLMDRLGINAEKVMREIGEPSLVDLYMNEGKWGMAVAGFETDPNVKVQDVQSGGVAHPLFNAKFPGKNAFILDGAYDLNEMFTPVEMTGPSGAPYTKTASQMLAGSMYVKGQPLSGQGSFEYKNVSPSGRRIQASKGNRDSEINKFIRENAGQYSPDEISQAIQDELGMSKQDADKMVADAIPTAQAPLAEEIQTFQEGTGEEQPRAMADQFDNLNPETEQLIDEEARTYFSKTNKQTDAEVDKFMEGKSMSDLADYVVSNPNIPARVKIWMAAKVAKNLGAEVEAARANGDQAAVQVLSQKRANIYNDFAKEATELGQAVQAFVAFQNDPSATNFFMNKILKQLKEKGVESVTDQQKEEITNLLTDLSNAKPGLPKNKAIIALSHYLGRLAPVKMGDVVQAIWYAHILSGVTTQLKNIFANTTMITFELPIGATWQAMKNMSLMPYVYAAKGFGSGVLKGLVKGADILRGGVTEKDANKFMGNEPILEYFSWKQTKAGKLGGGAVGKFLDFPLFIGISPKTLKMVGRALAGADAFFSTAAQEAMANMMAYNQAVAEGRSGITPNGYRRVQEMLGNTKQVVENAEQTAIAEGFKPGTIEFNRRVIELTSEVRDEQNKVAAEDFGKRVTLTNEPEGFTRGIYQVATAVQEYLPASRVVIPFTRIVSNISEMIINYSPAGAYRALTGIKNPKLSFKFTPGEDNKLSDEARGELFLKSSMAIAGVTLLMSNVGDDEDDWFDVTGGGPADFQKKYELMKGGWRPYSIKTKDGKYINYSEWPIAGALSGLGTMRDIQQYEKSDVKKEESRLGLAAYGYLSVFYDKSLLKGLSDFVDIFRLKGKYGPDATTVDKVEKFAANQAKALSMTNFSQQVFKMIQEYNDDPIKEAKGWETLYRDLPVINDGLNPIIDVFGDPVTPSTSERLLPWMRIDDEKKDKMISFLNKKGIYIGIPEEKPFIELDTRTEREMTRDELYRYRKMSGEYTKAILINRIDDMQKAADRYEGENKQKAWEKMTQRAVSAARKRAYADLLLNRTTDINKMFEDLND